VAVVRSILDDHLIQPEDVDGPRGSRHHLLEADVIPVDQRAVVADHGLKTSPESFRRSGGLPRAVTRARAAACGQRGDRRTIRLRD
jgi:hypothetical protein